MTIITDDANAQVKDGAETPNSEPSAVEAFAAAINGDDAAPQQATDSHDAQTGADGQPAGDADGGDDTDAGAAADDAAAAADDASPEAAIEKALAAENAARKAEGKEPLSESSAKRFRELAARPTKEAVEAQIKPLREAAGKWEQFSNIFRESTSTPDQLNSFLGYARAVNSGDPAMMSQAYDALAKELDWLGAQLGRQTPGHDPLAAHKDLQDAVASGDINRDYALQVAQGRAAQTRGNEYSQRQAQQAQQQREREQAAQRERMQAESDIEALGTELEQIDPHHAYRLSRIQARLRQIRDTEPPSKWVSLVREAYLKVPAPAAGAAAAQGAGAQRAPVAAMPLRPNGAARAQVQEPKNALDAFKMGMGGQ